MTKGTRGRTYIIRTAIYDAFNAQCPRVSLNLILLKFALLYARLESGRGHLKCDHVNVVHVACAWEGSIYRHNYCISVGTSHIR